MKSKLVPLPPNPSEPPDPNIPSFIGPAADPQFGLQFVPDIDFAVKDPAIIASDVITNYQANFLAITQIAKTLAPGDPVRLFLLTVCYWLSQQRAIIDFTGKQNLLKYSTGSYLDNLGALYGQRGLRLQATPALTTLRFTLVAPVAFSVTVPAGTYCQAPNSVVFTTLADGVITAGEDSVDVPAQALVTGIIGNGFAPGQIISIINWNQDLGITVSNTTLSAGGSDAETDDQYRYRLWLAPESFSTCGPRGAYEFWALSASPDIIQCVVYSAPEIAGEVWLYPLLRGGQLPTSDVLALVQAACSANVKRPVTDYVTAKEATAFTYTLDIDYYVLQTNAVLLDSIQAAVTQVVNEWIAWEQNAISRDIVCDELIRRCLEVGAKRVVINSPSPSFQEMNFDQLAVHDSSVAPVINFAGLEDI
jgi:phage-related baseplate assembly protein